MIGSPAPPFWLNTDQNTATGYSPFGSIGADYNITYVGGSFYLYTGAAAQNLRQRHTAHRRIVGRWQEPRDRRYRATW